MLLFKEMLFESTLFYYKKQIIKSAEKKYFCETSTDRYVGEKVDRNTGWEKGGMRGGGVMKSSTANARG